MNGGRNLTYAIIALTFIALIIIFLALILYGLALLDALDAVNENNRCIK